MEYFVYTYYSETHEPYYVGMGKNRRHMKPHLHVEVPPIERIELVENLTQEEAWELEIKLIDEIGMACRGEGPLLNLQRGGKTSNTGWHHSPKSRDAISKGNKGKVRTKEQKENYRGPKSDAHRESIRQARIGAKHKDSTIVKLREQGKKRRWFTDGTRSVFVEPGLEPSGFSPGRVMKSMRSKYDMA